jgi:hypothetical protein
MSSEENTPDCSDSESFPTTEAGGPDYEEAAREMGLADVSPRNPSYLRVHGDVLAVIRVDVETGVIEYQYPTPITATKTHSCNLMPLWHDWVNGSLTFAKREFLHIEEGVYDTEAEIPIPIGLLKDALAVCEQEGRQMEYAGDGEYTDKVERAIAGLKDALEEVGESE